MADYLLPHIGPVNLPALEEYYETEIEFEGYKISVDINFENKTISLNKMDVVKNFIENIKNFDSQNRVEICERYGKRI